MHVKFYTQEKLTSALNFLELLHATYKVWTPQTISKSYKNDIVVC